jgi:ADP-ribose pyrophosphatase
MQIVIGDGLTRGILSPEKQFQGIQRNLGAREIGRLMGTGRNFGKGPLPSFLHRVSEPEQESLKLILLKDVLSSESDGEDHHEVNEVMGEWVEPLESVAESASVVLCPPDQIAWKELLETLAQVTGLETTQIESGEAPLSFLVLGCHTEKRIQALATFLRNVLGFPHVAVCSHLVGSATQEAHFATLRHNLPRAGVQVLLDLQEAAAWVGVTMDSEEHREATPCQIGPPEARDHLPDAAARIVQLICMHWNRTHLRPLAGGYSGSLLFLADGWKGEAKTEPFVVKIDEFGQMRRELDGYHQVKDFFGKHVPTFGYPITVDGSMGVGMELAAMEGRPTTLQELFESAEDDASLAVFLDLLDKTLGLLSDKLYANTGERTSVVPFRAFGLHVEQQGVYLRRNAEVIQKYMEEFGVAADAPDLEQILALLRVVTRNGDSLESEVCIQHGDLNFANVICDEGGNVWFIDWTHTSTNPIELDFCKLENDVKFVMSKAFEIDDLPRLKKFGDYLLSQRIPGEVDELPDDLQFAKWDLRFRKMLGAVRRIRKACFALKEDDSWLVYRVGMLRYATHNLSFDKRRGMGECAEIQLIFAYHFVESLLLDLVADDFHLKIRAERPPSYPERNRVSIDQALWVMDCEEYDPPYHVDPLVLAHDRTRVEGGWADPEDLSTLSEILQNREAKFRDDEGRPLNPRGRTGIAGRGLLGQWGANLSVAGVVIRVGSVTGNLEILLGSEEDSTQLELPKGFLLPDEAPEKGLQRVIEVETGWADSPKGELVSQGYVYDARQTDHAWVEGRGFLLTADAEQAPDVFHPTEHFDEVGWWPLDAETARQIPSGQATQLLPALERMKEIGRIDAELIDRLISLIG